MSLIAWYKLNGNAAWSTPTASQVGAAASNHTHSYLPLSGGTISGGITPNADRTIALGSNSYLFADLYTDSIRNKSASPVDVNFAGKTLVIDAGYGSMVYNNVSKTIDFVFV